MPQRKIFIISDTHFGHENIIKYAGRPFKDAASMDQAILNNWNAVVSKDDIVWHLGDVYFSGGKSPGYWTNWLNMLNGTKYLMLGNHDNPVDTVLSNVFDKIYPQAIAFKEYGLVFSHYPMHPESFELTEAKLKNLHGHIHEKPSPSGPYQNMSVEWTNYTPVNIEELRIKQWADHR